ncbi:hypothetical protein [Paraburkholderia sediminicola]|uniref:hypothetical protein n=1 Tax=Paraburkholderia sediminicola TaxID=458836 RepID=UPI0038B700E6
MHVTQTSLPGVFRYARAYAGMFLFLVLVGSLDSVLGAIFLWYFGPLPVWPFWGVLIGILTGLLALIQFRVATRLLRLVSDRATKSVMAAAAVPSLEANQLMILRHHGDEASAIIATGYIWSWFVTRLTVVATRAVTSVVRAYEMLETPDFDEGIDRLGIWAWPVCLLPIGLVIGAGWATILAHHWPASTVIASGSIPGVLFSWKHWGLALMIGIAWTIVATLTVGLLIHVFGVLLLAPWFFAVALPVILLIGPELIFTIGHMEVTAESAPPGKWIVTTVNLSTSPEGPHSSRFGLKHSLLYQNSDALDEIAGWIEERCQQP